MLTVDELKEALEQVEESQRLSVHDTGNCSACVASVEDYGPAHPGEPHEPDCRYVRVRDALKQAIEKHAGDDAPAYAYYTEGYEAGGRDAAFDERIKVVGWLRAVDDRLHHLAGRIERGEHWK